MKVWTADEIREASQVNSPDEIEREYVEFAPGHGFIIIRNVFKNFELFREVIRSCPFYPNTLSKLNPFYTNVAPDALLKNVKEVVSTPKWNNLVSSYGNYYTNELINCTKVQSYPHADSFTDQPKVLVSNIWLSEHNPKNKTCFYYNKKTGKYNWSGQEYFEAAPAWRERVDQKFRNFVEDDYLVKVGEAPTETSTISIYFSDLIHAPHVDYDDPKPRHSYVLMFGDNNYMNGMGGMMGPRGAMPSQNEPGKMGPFGRKGGMPHMSELTMIGRRGI